MSFGTARAANDQFQRSNIMLTLSYILLALAQFCEMKSSTSCNSTSGFSNAAKCPPCKHVNEMATLLH